jgi:hypothetical protein
VTPGQPMIDFAIKDCALSHIATGARAQTLRELRDILRAVHPGCIYHHFWGTLLRPQYSNREYNNDFASWCHESLHDRPAAERLSAIDPADFVDLEELRQEVIDVVESRIDETELVLIARADQQFHFVRSVIVVFDTGKRLQEPRQLVEALPQMSPGSVFYHFIDARRRDPVGVDDFRAWMLGLGEEYLPLCNILAEVDPYFESLYVLRDHLSHLVARYFGEEERRGGSDGR